MRSTSTRAARRLAGAAAVCAVLLAACGGDDDDDDASAGAGSAETEATSSTGSSPADGSTVGSEAPSGPTTDAEGDPVDGGTLRVVYSSNPSSLDPVQGGSGGDHVSLYLFYDRLINLDPTDLTPQPGLATDWTQPDPQTLELTLREGVTFHDGTPFDAAAVKANLDRGLTLESSTVKADLAMIASVEVVDPTHVRVNFNRPDSSLVQILGDRPGMMVSPTAAEDPESLGLHPVGTGPFVFSNWVQGDRLEATKNPDYWQEGLPHLDGITYRFLTDQQTGLNALTAGEADFHLRVRPESVEQLERVEGLEVVDNPSLWLEDCYFNYSRPPFDDARVRRAANLAIDRDSFTEGFTYGMGAPAVQAFPAGYWAHQDDLEDAYPHDVEQARALLAEAGYPDGVAIKGIAGSASAETLKSEIVQAMLAEAGIDMTFEVMEVGPATTTFFNDLGHDLYCAGWSGRPDPSQTANSLFGPASFYNAGKVATPGMAEALAAAGYGADLEARGRSFHDVIDISQQESLFIPLSHVPDINAFRDGVGGFQPTLYGKPDLSFLWLES
jgi:peptide/nickel transport system permease protein/peptide/nickel transport system substrate-binding protein